MKLNAVLKLLVAVACASCITACNAQEAESSATEPATQSVTEVATTAVEEPTEDITSVTLVAETSTTIADKYKSHEIVDNRWWDLCKTLKFKMASMDKQGEMTVELLEELASEGYVEPDSIEKDVLSVTFRYIDGSKGCYLLKKFDSHCD